MWCDICKRSKRTRRADGLLNSPFNKGYLFGLINYFAPVWNRWHICYDCLDDLCYMILAINDVTRDVPPSIATADFKRHADAIHARLHWYENPANAHMDAHTYNDDDNKGGE